MSPKFSNPIPAVQRSSLVTRLILQLLVSLSCTFVIAFEFNYVLRYGKGDQKPLPLNRYNINNYGDIKWKTELNTLVFVMISTALNFIFYLWITVRLCSYHTYMPSVAAYGLAIANRWGAITVISFDLLLWDAIPNALGLILDLWIFYTLHRYTTPTY